MRKTMFPSGRCTRCRCRVPGLFVQCHKCNGAVITSTDTRDSDIPALLLSVLGVGS